MAQPVLAPSRIFLGAAVFVGLFLLLQGRARASQRWETLQAIHWVENPDDLETPGPFGELGPYQFRSETWRRYTGRPFRQALDRKASDEVAVKYYESIKSSLERSGVAATAYNIAMAWNAGINAVVNDTAPASSHDYASRVENLAVELHGRVASSR